MKSIASALTLMSALFVLSTPLSHADIEARFTESAPKDIFTLENLSQCDFSNVILEIDLSNSAGKLIFDTTGTGPGVDVFQPFEIRHGLLTLTSANEVRDGESALSVRIDQINAGDYVSFTIDVDDTLPKGELGNIRVSGSEIEGGTVYLTLPDKESVSANFSEDATARVNTNQLCAISAL